MKTKLFQDDWIDWRSPDAQERYDKHQAQRARDVRAWIETGPGRLSADEKMVIAWYREAKDRVVASNYDGGRTSVDVLMVGNPGVVGIVNHQLDHIGGGLTAIMNGIDVARTHEADTYAEVVGMETPRPIVSVDIKCNRLDASEIVDGDMISEHAGQREVMP
ncbi:MAG: hypothetical protein LBK99_05190 [Opitutaceae bacterium]|jgi:hypothetical protein|nr:hypothetical protein [Opitutaceae bacterium]